MVLAVAAQGASQGAQQAVGYPSLFLLVALGSLVPVIPTGAVVSSATVVGLHNRAAPLTLLLVFAVASAAAFLGDVALYWLGLRGVRSRNGSLWLRKLRERAPEQRLESARRGLDEHGVAVLVVSRLIPAGRIPVMVACLLSEMSIRRFVRGAGPACLVWAVLYQAIGVLGGSLFAKPWQGVAVVTALTVVISVVPIVWRRLRRA